MVARNKHAGRERTGAAPLSSAGRGRGCGNGRQRPPRAVVNGGWGRGLPRGALPLLRRREASRFLLLRCRHVAAAGESLRAEADHSPAAGQGGGVSAVERLLLTGTGGRALCSFPRRRCGPRPLVTAVPAEVAAGHAARSLRIRSLALLCFSHHGRFRWFSAAVLPYGRLQRSAPSSNGCLRPRPFRRRPPTASVSRPPRSWAAEGGREPRPLPSGLPPLLLSHLVSRSEETGRGHGRLSGGVSTPRLGLSEPGSPGCALN